MHACQLYQVPKWLPAKNIKLYLGPVNNDSAENNPSVIDPPAGTPEDYGMEKKETETADIKDGT